MMRDATDKNRRRFIKLAGVGLAAAPIGNLLLSVSARAEDLPQVDEGDATAKALEYVHQSATDGQTCANCQLYQGEAGGEWGPCTIFPGEAVNANGWCKSWIVKAS